MNPTEYDHVYDINGKFYWADETGDLTGPLETLEEAKTAIDAYVTWLQQRDA